MIYDSDIHKAILIYIKSIYNTIPVYYHSEQSRNSKEKAYILINITASNFGSLHRALSRNIQLQVLVYANTELSALNYANGFLSTLSENYDLAISEEITLAGIKPLSLPINVGKSQNGLYAYSMNYEIIY